MGKTSLLVLVLFCLAFNSVNSARILAVLPAPSISHQIVFWPVINELVRRGHEVVSISPNPEHGKGKAPANLTEIDLHDISYTAWREILLKEVMGSTGEVVDQIKAIYMSLSKVFNEQMKVDEVRDIILKKKGNFDLLITETVSRPALAFSHIYKVPLVQISSFGPIVFNDHYVGSLTHPIFYPLPWHSKVYDLSTWGRIKKIWHHYSFQYYYNNVIGDYENKMLKTHFGPDVPAVSELCDDVDLLILDVHPLWIDNQPSPPSVVYVNGIHQKPPKELPKDIKSYLDSSRNGVIYMSFGTNVIPSAMPSEKLQNMLKVLSRFPYDVLFKWDKEKLPIEARNIKISKWFPQGDILRHPKIKLFIMQGGLQSMDEAFTAGVPMIGIPMLSDQWYNTDKFVKHKIGIRIDMEDLTEEVFEEAIHTAIEDKSYRENVVKLNALMQDQPQPPLERAVWWIEHVLRHGGASHLRARTANMPLAQFLQLDLVALALGAVAAVIIVVACAVPLFCKMFTNKKTKKIKNNYRRRFCATQHSIVIARAIVLVLSFVTLAKCARILAVFPVPSVSHQVVFRPITQELVRRGHEVVVITPDPAFPEGQAPVNLTEIDVHETAYEAWLEVINRDVVGKPNDFLTILEFMIKSTWKFFPAEMKTPAVQEIIHKKRGEFDLILTELCIRKCLGFSHIFKVPVIQISSLGSILYNDGIVGSETHPFLFPNSFNRRIYNLTLYEKFFQLWNDLRLKWTYSVAEEKEHELMKDVFGPDVPPLSVLKDNIHLTILNIHPIWADNQPVPPSVAYIGSIHQKPPKPLPLEYQSYLDASKRGVVYVSFGTNATPSKFAPETVQILLDVLCKLPYDVLLKWDQDSLPVDCSNIKISKWFPQYDILRHPNVKLFITQGGLQSTEESLAAGVPMIGLPILGDQWFNTEKYAHHRIGAKLEWSALDRESFRNAIDTIINDESYRKNVVKLGRIISDTPNTSLERAVWWVEYVLRHGGARHLRPPTANMSLYQYLEVDLMIAVLLVLFLITLTLSLAAYGIWRYYITKSFCGNKVKKS